MLVGFGRFLPMAPLPDRPTEFRMLTVERVDYTIPAEVEWDLRDAKYGPAEIAALAIQDLNEDTAFVVEAKWELWNFDIETLKWANEPQPLTLVCQGTAFEDGAGAAEGNFIADLGFEHLFTGHAGLLAPGAATNPFESSDHPVEERLRAWMGRGENLRQDHQRTEQNVRELLA